MKVEFCRAGVTLKVAVGKTVATGSKLETVSFGDGLKTSAAIFTMQPKPTKKAPDIVAKADFVKMPMDFLGH